MFLGKLGLASQPLPLIHWPFIYTSTLYDQDPFISQLYGIWNYLDTIHTIIHLSLLCFYTFNGVWTEFQLYGELPIMILEKKSLYITFHHHLAIANSIPAADIPEHTWWTHSNTEHFGSVVPQGWIPSIIMWFSFVIISEPLAPNAFIRDWQIH